MAGLSRNPIKNKTIFLYRSNELYEADIQVLGNEQAGPVDQKYLFSSFFSSPACLSLHGTSCVAYRLSPIPHSSWTRRTVSPEITNRPSNRAAIYMRFGTCPDFHHPRSPFVRFTPRSQSLKSELGLHCRVRQVGGLLGHICTHYLGVISRFGHLKNGGDVGEFPQVGKTKTNENHHLFVTYLLPKVSGLGTRWSSFCIEVT